MDSLKGMDKLLKMYHLPKLNQEEIENVNRPITSNQIEAVILKLTTNKIPESDGFTDEFYQTFQKELTPILLKRFQKPAEGTLPNSLYEVSITLIPRSDITHEKKKITGQNQ